MSNRTLTRMQPGEIESIISFRARAIATAYDAEAKLAERKEFSERASRTLGYTPLQNAMSQESVDVPADVVLLKTLLNIGIIPIEYDSVGEYMRLMTENRNNAIVKLFGFIFLAIGALTTFIISVCLLRMPHDEPLALLRQNWIWPTLLGSGAFLLWYEYTLLPRKVWEKADLKSLSHSWSRGSSNLLPRESLEIALRIKEKLPNVTFAVYSLVQTLREVNLLDPDPFLQVRFGGEAYFIAAWDEPGFDGKLIKID